MVIGLTEAERAWAHAMLIKHNPDANDLGSTKPRHHMLRTHWGWG